jgi:signal transduction histidine kinase
MPLPRIVRTTSFRLTLLYAGLFFASVMLLFAAMYWYGTGYVAGQIDRTVANEIAELETNAKGRGLTGLRDTVAAYARQAPPDVYYYLSDVHGHRLAGNVPALPRAVGIQSWASRRNGGQFPVGRHSVRGLGVVGVDGSYLFVGLDSFELHEMREMITRAFVWGSLATILLALVGGTIMSLGLLRRVEAISQASREIMAGDLSRRIPVRSSHDEFDHLAESLNAMLERIEGLMEELKQVTNDIAHDLRTPLTRLRQRLELAHRRPSSPEELRGALETSADDVDAILDTFAALLRIAQIEAHSAAAGFQALDLSEVLSEIAEIYQSVAEAEGRLLVTRVAPGLSIPGDRELLLQLLSNLIENAIRHCPTASVINLSASRNAHGVEVVVADNGPGIPQALREKVFQRFYRMERSRTTPGTGLGLSLVAAIAKLHRARIALFDNGPGLRVQLVFPAIKGVA